MPKLLGQLQTCWSTTLCIRRLEELWSALEYLSESCGDQVPFAALAALAATASFAQSSVTISGGISTGIMDTGAAGTKAGVAQLGNGANAINIKSTEDLGGGLTGGFDSQIRYNAVSGDRNSSGTGNALFHAANAFIGGGFGTVRVGKIAEASNCGMDPWACGGGAGVIAGAGGTSALVGALTQASSVSYATPTIMGFSASYQTTVTSAAKERTVLNIAYANGPISAQFLQTENGVNTAGDVVARSVVDGAVVAPTGLPTAGTKGTSIGASYNFGVAKLNLVNVVTKDASNVTAKDITAVTATAPMGAYTLLAAYAKDSKQVSATDTKMALGVNYALSKRTTLGADVFKDEALKNTTGAAGTGFVVRVAHTF